jgi:hypothetical protein
MKEPAYPDEVSSQDEGGWRPDYPRGVEPAEGPDILEQGRDRPPASWRAVRLRQPPTIAIILGVTGLLVGLAAGFSAGTLHAEKATAPSAQSSATASPTPISPVLIGGASSQFQLLCSPTGTLLQPGTSFTNVPTPTALPMPTATGTVIIIFPSAGPKLTCPDFGHVSGLISPAGR